MSWIPDRDADGNIVLSSNPFTAKTLPNGKKIYTRTHGISFMLSVGSNICDFSVPHPQVKFNALEVVGCENGDRVSLKILDTPTGAVSSVPNYELNQFGFNVGLPDGFYVRESSYDADLIGSMTIRVEYNSQTNKSVIINYVLHEIK